MLGLYKLWDHMDSILSLAVTGLVDRILEVKQPSGAVVCEITSADIDQLDRHQARDLLLLAACYDQSTAETFKGRWHHLRQRLKFQTWQTHWQVALGGQATALILLIVLVIVAKGGQAWLPPWWVYPILLVGVWWPWLWKVWKTFWLARGILDAGCELVFTKRIRCGKC